MHATLQDETAAIAEAQQILTRTNARVAAKERALAQTRQEQRKIDWLLAQSEKRLEAVHEDISIAEMLALALKECMEMLCQIVIVWTRPKQDKTTESRLIWGPNAPQSHDERNAILDRIAPAIPRLAPLGRVIAEVIDRTLATERLQLARDAALVAGLRDDWDAGQKAELERIQRKGPDME